MSAKDQFCKILEYYGRATALEANKLLSEIKPQNNTAIIFDYISKTWLDQLTPAMMTLSCKAVGGQTKKTRQYAIALSLLNLSFKTWDDVIDKTSFRSLRTTTVGKFGEKNSIIIGGLLLSKAFLVLNQTEPEIERKAEILKVLWKYITSMAEAEISDNEIKPELYLAKNKLKKIKTEAIALETCLQIGSIIGNGSKKEILALRNYGKTLEILIELRKDLLVSLNLTIELEQKIKNKKLPYFVLKTKEKNRETRRILEKLTNADTVDAQSLGIIVNNVLRENQQSIEKTVYSLTRNGLSSLEDLKPSIEKEKMKEILDIQTRLVTECLVDCNSG